MTLFAFPFIEVALGSQAEFRTHPIQLDVAASVERDADHDGFGDASQDQCPTNGARHGACKCKKHSKKHVSRAGIAKKCEKKHHH
jgi:hypothetical protein